MRIVSTLDIHSYGKETPELHTALDNLNRTMEIVQQVSQRVNEGKGTVGRLLNDDTIANNVEQITWSGAEGMKRGQEVVYVTERAVFRLTPKGLVLSEVAPGIDVKRDVIARMQFAPVIERSRACNAWVE